MYFSDHFLQYQKKQRLILLFPFADIKKKKKSCVFQRSYLLGKDVDS